MNPTRFLFPILTLFVLAAVATTQERGQLILDTVEGKSLGKSITNEVTKRAVAVYLPPSYSISPEHRYPVLYLLHGIGGTHRDWVGSGQRNRPWRVVQEVMDRSIAAGEIEAMIIVAADQRTHGGGSFYTNSSVTGAWEDFTVIDLVEYADSTYRTLPQAESRGIAGHSMGGYGAIKLGMKHPEVFQVVFGMSSALLGFAGDLIEKKQSYARAATARPKDLNPRVNFWPPSLLCVAQALSPNPRKPPFYADLPFAPLAGEVQRMESAYERWEAQMPLNMVTEFAKNLGKLRALRFDAGRQEQFTHILITNRAFSDRLTKLKIPHTYEEFNGDHNNRLWGAEGRVRTELLPFFSRQLARDE